jgi:hypothetical protein
VKKRKNVTKTHQKKRNKKGSTYILGGMQINFGGFEFKFGVWNIENGQVGSKTSSPFNSIQVLLFI